MKRFIALSLGILLILTGCSVSTDIMNTLNENKPSVEMEESVNSLSTKNNKNEVGEPSIGMNLEYIGSKQIENLTDFSEERAFIQFDDYSEVETDDVKDAIKAYNGDENDKINYVIQHWDDDFQGFNRAALIDTQGKIIWKSEFTKENIVLRESSQFKNGLAYFVFNGNEKSAYTIIDSDGNVTFTRDFSEDFIILEQGDGLFLVAEHITNFDTDEWQLGAMDRNGTMVVPYKTYVTDTPPTAPAPVEQPSDYSADLQDIEDSLSQLAAEYQEWLEECWDYQGERDAEYYKRTNETETDYKYRRKELEERRQQLRSEYEEQLEKYEDYQYELSTYEITMEDYEPKKLSFDRDYNNYDYYVSCEYLGESIYKLNFSYGFVLVNIDTQSIINIYEASVDTEGIEQFITGFEKGAATILYKVSENSCYLCNIETNGEITAMENNIWTKYILQDILSEEYRFHDGLLFVPYDYGGDMDIRIDREYYAMTMDAESAYENGFIFHTGVYYNIQGEIVIDFPEYRGKKEFSCSPFYNGHAVLMVQGEDQFTYFTVINKEGESMFELKSGFDNAFISKDGKYLMAIRNGNLTIFDIKGNPLTSIDSNDIYPDIISIDNMDMYADNNANKYNICDGVIRFDRFYVNVQEGSIIGSTFFNVNDYSVTKY